MRKSKKQLLRTLIACGLVLSVAAGGTVAYLTDAETATNTFTVGKVKIDLEEPGYPGNDSDDVKNIIPNQEIVKDPQIENTGNNDALVFLRVEVPQETFTELNADNNVGEKKLQDLFKLKNVSDQWELLRTETVAGEDGKAKTSYVYGYKKILGKDATTDKLFQKVQMKNAVESDLSGNVEDIVVTACAIQATDIPDVNLTPGSDGNLSKDVLDQVYTIFLNQSGNQTSRPANEGDRNQTGKLGKISYELDGGTLADGSLTEYGSADYGYTPPAPAKKNYTFTGWEPENIPSGSTGKVTLTAKWTPTVLGSILYNLNGGSLADEKTSYTVEDYEYTPPNPTKTDYKFIGWTPASIPIDSTGNISFTAQWKENSAELLDGESINVKMKRLAGTGSAEYKTEDTAITAIQRTDEEPTEAVMADANSLISTNASAEPVYAWFENGVIKWWSEAKDVNAGESLAYLCYNMRNLTDISGLNEWQTGNVTYMNYMFYGCSNLTGLVGLADWDTGNVTDMSGVFENCSQLTDLTPLAHWQTGKVTNMDSMFCRCSNLTGLVGLADWDTGNVTDMSGVFGECSQLTDLTPLAYWQTGKVTSMRYMFVRCVKLTNTVRINRWDISKVTTFTGMFGSCPSHPKFTKKSGTWDRDGTFNPTT
ncbi:BspA family leucine-rich repeat surface protein [Clostridiaceae bacterium CLA-AA-H274]|uniref:BspA family leucine-rich repeat surface protein n=3 Tax=Brotaphodocola catenula TaxID=2885361 RepID=A0AAE3DI55_9FIRM|nr:TasA family protein [Brotaphodocola catenula]MCC2164700.1 BspA family leucine-rich repeat surface protein [Brotaphodocola catenula]